MNTTKLKKKAKRCPFCDDPKNDEYWSGIILEHLIITMDLMGKIHIHGPIEKENIMLKFIDELKQQVKLQVIKNKASDVDSSMIRQEPA